MNPSRPQVTARLLCALSLLAALSGCGGGEASPSKPAASGGAQAETVSTGGGSSSGGSEAPAAETKPARPNAPVLHLPEASGTATLGTEPLAFDISHADQGYVMAQYTGASAKANIQITGPDGITYKYFITPADGLVTMPLTGGSGTYTFDTYENIVDNQYSVLGKETADIQISDELLPYLYPNQYVDFDAGTKAVAKASEVVAGAQSDLDAVSKVYHYVVENVTYDKAFAETNPKGYIPTVDTTLETGTGICLDYAALTCCMLRSQNIPARLEIGYAGKIYHAWISVYTEETGWIDKLIEFSGDWTRMDPTFASGNNSSDAILKYIGDGTNYNLQYLH